MPWAKVSDTAATHPALMRVASHATDQAVAESDVVVNELFGWFMRCAVQSASHLTDYLVDVGTARMLGGPRADVLIDLALRSDLIAEVEHRGVRAFRLLEDADFVHLRLRDEVMWERQRGRDTSNPALTVPVRLRDGDACRYCGNIVRWSDRKNGRGGTYDHVHPTRGAKSPDELRVACRSCNSQRGDDAAADLRVPPLPAPTKPFYGEATVAFLAKHGHQVTPSTQRPETPSGTARRAGSQPDVPQRPEIPSGTARRAGSQPDVSQRPANPPGTAQRADSQPVPATPISQTPADRATRSTARDGAHPGSGKPTSTAHRGRRSRGRRGSQRAAQRGAA